MTSELGSLTIASERDFPGPVLAEIPLHEATRRVLAYCTEPGSGWGTYDLAGTVRRQSGLFDTLTSWSLLYANALNGQVTLSDVAAFGPRLQEDYANRLARVPLNQDLHTMNPTSVSAVIDACQFGFPGVWGPKITKVGALYRPSSIPVLDGHVAMAYGFKNDAFTNRARQSNLSRNDRIAQVVQALATAIASQQEQIRQLRSMVQGDVPQIELIPDLRLLDIVIWTSQDDRMPRRKSQGPPWIERKVGTPPDPAEFEPITTVPPAWHS